MIASSQLPKNALAILVDDLLSAYKEYVFEKTDGPEGGYPPVRLRDAFQKAIQLSDVIPVMHAHAITALAWADALPTESLTDEDEDAIEAITEQLGLVKEWDV